ncbi:MAG: dienelactone hydrolase family protein [Methylococcales bacterium]|nr:dienelactone hydrolase family protein [Methylococcales bacterium]
MRIVSDVLAYTDDNTALQAYVAYDAEIKGPMPTVLVCHAWAGRDGFVEAKARQLAELGYLGVALDVYGEGVLGQTPEQNTKLMQPFMADRGKLRQRLLAGLEAAVSLSQVDRQRIAAIGFCFGGLCVLDLARSGASLRGVVSFHGLLRAPEALANEAIQAKVLVLHGHDDPMVPVEDVVALETELTEAGVDWQVHVYGQTLHAFTNPQANDVDFGTVYQPDAERRSWQAMRHFLAEIFV